MTSPVRCALIGAGRIAQTYAQALAACDELRPVAVVDTSAEAARKVADTLGCRPYQSLEAMTAIRPDVEGKHVQQLPVEDTVRIYVRSAGGVLGSIDLSWSLNKEQDAYLTLHGSAGTLLVGWKESKYRLHDAPEWTVFGKGYDKAQAFR